MKETNGLFIKLCKNYPQYIYTKETLELNFFVEMRAINVFFEKLNKKYEKQAEEIVLQLNNDNDIVLVKNAFKRFSKAVQTLYLEPISKSTPKIIEDLIYNLEVENVEKYFYNGITEEEKTKYLNNLKKFDDYKNFLLVFTKHIECYIRFFYENLRKKIFFWFWKFGWSLL